MEQYLLKESTYMCIVNNYFEKQQKQHLKNTLKILDCIQFGIFFF